MPAVFGFSTRACLQDGHDARGRRLLPLLLRVCHGPRLRHSHHSQAVGLAGPRAGPCRARGGLEGGHGRLRGWLGGAEAARLLASPLSV